MDDVVLEGNVLYTYASGSNKVTAIFAVGQDPVVSSVTYCYAVAAGENTSAGTAWTFAVDGAEVSYVIDAGTTMPTADHVYTLTAVGDGTYTISSSLLDCSGDGTEVTLADTAYFVAGSAYTYGTDCGVFNVYADDGAADTLEVGDMVYVYASSSTALVVYIVG